MNTTLDLLALVGGAFTLVCLALMVGVWLFPIPEHEDIF
jgi:hypothetical protein